MGVPDTRGCIPTAILMVVLVGLVAIGLWEIVKYLSAHLHIWFS
jgi:hypothetical protein